MGDKRDNKIASINTKLVQQVAERNRVIKVRKHRFYTLIGFFAVIFIVFGVQIIQTKYSLSKVNDQIEAKNESLSKTKAKNKKLDKQVELLHDDSYLQKILRQKYYYSKTGETIYSLSDSSK
ncbi:hypothetical protein FC70_GL000029 [Paucilactobacillus oligofermentans DSM 15707 = LMG 22743]|uniref:Septum formation initiator n=1 Tax=Paucilactobacillus oligofermentans DSM 15707 = LMG 22743 TaxID=1423778 RepID=A0A0R1RLX3_9LACO|nr:septum formation initiator family protein [Paucilactobacillus oligofermentans]KRL58141.1 hypothetical protein FC70_GL000029 [Paucilactobacillus oligofermentans DSM 15707 = LMG 22743]CUS26842.1 Septum formation initiator protein DivIC [Paucilactobacillus oligofermentans DSM 15707 = LMG 22743]